MPFKLTSMTLFADFQLTSLDKEYDPHLGLFPLAFKLILPFSGVPKSKSGLDIFQFRFRSRFLFEPVTLTSTLLLNMKASASCLDSGSFPCQVIFGSRQSFPRVILVENELSVSV